MSATLPVQTASAAQSFIAMGCPLVVNGATGAELKAIQELFSDYEQAFSRFISGSELNRVNTTAASYVSPLFREALAAAYEAADFSDGLVDFSLGADLEALGYDRDFASLTPSDQAPAPTRGSRLAAVGWDGQLLIRPPDVKLDLNGVVKGLAVDRALALLAGPGFVACGGDLASRGPVVVGLPGGGSARVCDGGMATSGSTRRWLRGRWQHHLLDPVSGRPAASCWTQVTVAATTCLTADVAAKAALLAGADGPRWLDERGLPGRFVDAGGAVSCNESWRQACP